MNAEELAREVTIQSGKDYATCVAIINSYKKYCENELKCPFKEEVDKPMLDWVCALTKHDERTVNGVLNVFISLVRSKIPFMK